jgi:hypothetical protein
MLSTLCCASTENFRAAAPDMDALRYEEQSLDTCRAQGDF